jgi:hypothetical protein
LLDVKVIIPLAVGVMEKVWATNESLKVRTIGVERPPPEGVMVIVPEYKELGVTVKLLEAVFTNPEPGPEKV